MKFSRVFLAFALVFASLVAAQARNLSQIKQSGVIKIGIRDEKSSLLEFTDANGTLHSFDKTLAARLALDLGVNLELVHVTPQARIDAVAMNFVDIMLGDFTQTRDREREVDFALPYMKISLGVISRKDALIATAADLRSKTIIAVSGTTAASFLREKYKNIATIIETADYPNAFEALLHGEGDGMVTDNVIALAWAKEHKEFAAEILRLGKIDVIAPAVKKGNRSLLIWLNEEISGLARSGFLRETFLNTLGMRFYREIRVEEFIIE